jgi:CO dehydrogenase/acetyl-CoA synthase beta subunit
MENLKRSRGVPDRRSFAEKEKRGNTPNAREEVKEEEEEEEGEEEEEEEEEEEDEGTPCYAISRVAKVAGSSKLYEARSKKK